MSEHIGSSSRYVLMSQRQKDKNETKAYTPPEDIDQIVETFTKRLKLILSKHFSGMHHKPNKQTNLKTKQWCIIVGGLPVRQEVFAMIINASTY